VKPSEGSDELLRPRDDGAPATGDVDASWLVKIVWIDPNII